MAGLFGSFIDDFILLINELSTQQKILIIGDFNLDQILPERVAKVDPLIQKFNLLRVHDIQLKYMGEYWIWYLILYSDTISSLPSNLINYFYTEFRCKQFSFQSSLHY